MNFEQYKAIHAEEKAKYRLLWNENYRSGRAAIFPQFVHSCIQNNLPGDKLRFVLDIGCGDCTTMRGLKELGYIAHGCDITTRHIKHLKEFKGFIRECPAWATEYNNQAFEVTISTDVLEHIPPPMVEHTIQEIFRITSGITIHSICTGEDHLHQGVHLSIHSIEWWLEQFQKQNQKGIGIILVDTMELVGIKTI